MSQAAPHGSTSVWLPPDGLPDLGPLNEDTRADVCIVGAGIAGLTTAYLLERAGKKTVVLEAGEVGSGETGRTTAHLASALDDYYHRLEQLHGEQGARLAAESHRAAIDRIEAIARAEHIACDFERLDGYLFVPPGESTSILDRELDAARRAGLEVERVRRAPLTTFDTGAALRFAHQGQFHPMKYLSGLATALRRLGGRIFVRSRVDKFEGGTPAQATTHAGHTVQADALVVATNTPVNDWVTMHTKQFPYRSYAIALRVPRGSVPRALYWDTAEPYHYVRLQCHTDADDYLIVGGEDHKTGQAHDTDERFSRLYAWAKERFPEAPSPEFCWSGQIMEPMDSLAYIGHNPGDEPNVFIATGDSGHGMTHSTIAGMLLTDLITGKENAWTALYEPSRKTLRSAWTFLKENLNTAVQYVDWLTPGEVRSVDDIKPGDAAVMRRGLHKVAVYRDEAGRVHKVSATCSHLGCVVDWNPTEKTWDCPCHGSRFDVRGKVVNGPALTGLERLEE
ncbi:MAG TPA: FAD-dependent oxidoreductase [Gemmataceae bacterium]|nr:FAD-dependent oxidoreductase [Gemmataceae bacterium]